MKSKVYFSNLRSKTNKDNKIEKLKKLFDAAGMGNAISKDDITAVKVHFGESGGDGYVRPIFARPIVDKIKECGGNPFVTDTNTLYTGSRSDSVRHMNTAIEHGFLPSVVGAPVIIADGIKSNFFFNVPVDLKHFKETKISGEIVNSNSMIVISHFKGHEMAGFGGTIKNLAMGCTPAVGKQEQHQLKPFIKLEGCIKCGKCRVVCPVDAPEMQNDNMVIVKEKCIGCGECVTMCPTKTIEFDWATDIEAFTERMVEYAYGAVKDKEGKVGYINFLTNITPHCDCVPWSDAPIVADIGILASTDPVALDKASLDLVNKAQILPNTLLTENCNEASSCEEHNHFNKLWNNTRGEVQLSYGEKIGMGSQEYELIEI